MSTPPPQAPPPDAAPAEKPAAGSAAAPPAATWVPIRSLAPRHRGRIQQHLAGLGERDRYLRFGYPASDEQIKRYVDSLDFDVDEVFGVFNRRLELVALAHLAYPRPGRGGPVNAAAEFGGSVASHLRGKGLGARLFEHAMLHARNQGIDTLFIHALSENTAMLRIARKLGARVERDGSESEAYLRLPPDTLASQVEQWVGEGAAAIDYQMKQGARTVDALFNAIAEVKAGVGRSGRTGQD